MPGDVGEAARQEAVLQGPRHDGLLVEQAGVVDDDAGAAGHRLGQRDVGVGERRARPVAEGDGAQQPTPGLQREHGQAVDAHLDHRGRGRRACRTAGRASRRPADPRISGRPAASASPSSPTGPRSRGRRWTRRVRAPTCAGSTWAAPTSGRGLAGDAIRRTTHQSAIRGTTIPPAAVSAVSTSRLVDRAPLSSSRNGEPVLVALGGVGQAGPVEGERALGRDVLEQVVVLSSADAARIVEADAHRPERPAVRRRSAGRRRRRGRRSSRRPSRCG